MSVTATASSSSFRALTRSGAGNFGGEGGVASSARARHRPLGQLRGLRGGVATPVSPVLTAADGRGEGRRPVPVWGRHRQPLSTVSSSVEDGGVDFNDPSVYSSKSLGEVAMALGIFRVCTIGPLTRNIEAALALGNRVMGSSLMSALLRRTFFAHFCAGEDQNSIRPCIEHLRANGIGGILDYAAEADLAEADGEAVQEKYDGVESARIHQYDGEALCDENARIFEECIRAVHNVSPEGFAAIKVTALGDPALLQRAAESIVAIRRLFAHFDPEGRGRVSREDFRVKYHEMFQAQGKGEVDRLFQEFSVELPGAIDDDFIDYVEWTNGLQPESMWELARRCREKGEFATAALDADELRLWNAMVARIAALTDTARKLEVRLMIDAEQSYFQPAIDNLVVRLQREHNRDFPTIFNTYQCYLKDSNERCRLDMERAKREGYWFAAKLVRGAYMVAERQRAADRGEESPIHDTLADTHANYHATLAYILERMHRSNVLVASHNEDSVAHTIAEMQRRGIDPAEGGVYFGQLLGMADNITYALGQGGYKAYKYVPYGPVHEVMPYLIRRAQENSDLLGGVGKEITLLQRNLVARLTGSAGS